MIVEHGDKTQVFIENQKSEKLGSCDKVDPSGPIVKVIHTVNTKAISSKCLCHKNPRN